jgi:8-oxo-dGTP pyrophosphatase MutT (NUDIX family)
VVLDRREGVVHVALIQPAGSPEGAWSLPKGHLDAGEEALEAALREVFEETGLVCEAVRALPDVNYTFFADGRGVSKTVELWLMRVTAGQIDDLDESMRVEIARAQWLPLAEAVGAVTYRSESQALAGVAELLAAQGPPTSNS